jgi:hypothetical protein
MAGCCGLEDVVAGWRVQAPTSRLAMRTVRRVIYRVREEGGIE